MFSLNNEQTNKPKNKTKQKQNKNKKTKTKTKTKTGGVLSKDVLIKGGLRILT